MTLTLISPEQTIQTIVNFIKTTYQTQKIDKAVIAVSGGIDSALSLTLLSQALSKNNIFTLFLPYGQPDTIDQKQICEFNQIPKENIKIINITGIVDNFSQKLGILEHDQLRLGNLMARVRMISLYDYAKAKQALVCGTENKSEKYLGYFTRYGDEASDMEPIQHLYKTQVLELANYLHLPQTIVNKPPTAGLWKNQTDEQELGFVYALADQVMAQYIDQKKKLGEIEIEGISQEMIKKVIDRIKSQAFKHRVPYRLE